MPGVFENLKVGKWYAVWEIDVGEPGEFFMPKPRALDGHPFTIVAVSYPFVLCRSFNGSVRTFDTRYVTLTTVNDKYVRAWKSNCTDPNGMTPRPTATGKKRRKKKEKPDRFACPRCGGAMIQRMVVVANGWRWVCRECGFDKGMVLAGDR
jgi:predicted RNA-binding Zn-ribbon protein involved in translation (DUF1610 family)